MRRALALGVLLLAFFALRLPSLRLLPLYSDEGLGLWRAERVLEGSLTRGAGEGKPLHAWMIAAAIALPVDAIVAARAAHVLAGALLLVALWDLATRSLSPAVGWTAAALWVVLPFPHIFERTVTPDVPLAAAGVATMACALRVATAPADAATRGWRWALLAAGAAAMFTKMPVGLLLAATPLLVPLMLPAESRAAARSRLRRYRVALGVTVAALAAIVSTRAALGLRPLGFGMHEFERKVAVLRAPERAPEVAIDNLRRVGEYAWVYLGPLGTLFAIAGVVGALVGRDRTARVLALVALSWTVLFATSARNLSAHYLLAALPFYAVAMAKAMVEGAAVLERKLWPGLRGWLAPALVAAALLVTLVESWPLRRALSTDPSTAPFARTERLHYVEGDWSGYGLPEAARWIEDEIARGDGDALFVALHLADYERLRLYAGEEARRSIAQLQVERYTLRVPIRIERARSLLESGRRVLVVVGSENRFERHWREAFPQALRRAVFPKPGGARSVEVWELEPQENRSHAA